MQCCNRTRNGSVSDVVNYHEEQGCHQTSGHPNSSRTVAFISGTAIFLRIKAKFGNQFTLSTILRLSDWRKGGINVNVIRKFQTPSLCKLLIYFWTKLPTGYIQTERMTCCLGRKCHNWVLLTKIFNAYVNILVDNGTMKIVKEIKFVS